MMASKKPRGSSTRRWHRYIGVGASIFVVFLVISGLALNHAHQLSLDQRHVSPPWLLRWYGLGEPEQLRSFAVGSQWLSFTGTRLYLDGNNVTTATHGVGAVTHGDWLVAASTEEVLLLDHDGGLIERLRWEPTGAGSIEAIGRTESGAVVVKSGGKAWLADAEFLNWSQAEAPADASAWSTSEAAPAAVKKAIAHQHSGNGLSLEQLLLDTHSGRIFGWVGMLIYDVLALILGFSALSGLVLWWRTRSNGKNDVQRN